MADWICMTWLRTCIWLVGSQSRREAEALLTWWKLRLVKITNLSYSAGLWVPSSSCCMTEYVGMLSERWVLSSLPCLHIARELITRSWVCLKHVLPCVQQKVVLAWVQTVSTRSWENKPVAISLEIDLHFQAQKGRDWTAASYLLSADFQLTVTKQSNSFSPCTSLSAAYVHCPPVLALVELCSELDQGANLPKNEYLGVCVLG